MPSHHRAALTLALLLDGSLAVELIPVLSRQSLRLLIEVDVAAVLGAVPNKRTRERLDYRKAHSLRILTTQMRDIKLQITKLRAGSLLHSIFDGVSTHKVDALVGALGSESGISY